MYVSSTLLRLCKMFTKHNFVCFYLFQAAKVDSTNANIFVHRGLLALQARADVNGARELIQKAIKVDPKCEFAYETLGTLEVRLPLVTRSDHTCGYG